MGGYGEGSNDACCMGRDAGSNDACCERRDVAPMRTDVSRETSRPPVEAGSAPPNVTENAATGGKSDLARAFSEDGALKTHVGGQALIEGIMMRGKFNWAVAVREPEGGIYVEEHDLASGRDGNGWMHWPLVRGCRALVESLALGYKALGIAAQHAFADEEPVSSEATDAASAPESRISPDSAKERSAFERASLEKPAAFDIASVESSSGDGAAAPLLENRNDDRASLGASFESPDVPEASTIAHEHPAAAEQAAVPKEPRSDDDAEFGKREMAVSMVLGLVLGVVLFVVAPAFVTNLIVGEYDSNTVLWNIVDGLLRVAVFVFYLWLIGRMSDIKRMFGYHGAEHKTIHCYEHDLPLTPENARSFPRLHVRCGTAFLIMVMIIAIFVYTVTPINGLIAAWGVPDGAPKLALVIVVRILLMPVIAGLSYEITVKWAGSHPDNPLVKVVLWPGMQMQYLTTNEPDDGQIECAIAAMQRVLERERAEAAPGAVSGEEVTEKAASEAA